MRPIAIVVACLALLALTGCTAFQPVALKREQDGLHISICQSFAGDQLIVKTTDSHDNVATIWRAEGAFDVEKKAEYVFGIPPTGMTNVVGPNSDALSRPYIDVFFRNGGVDGQVAGHFVLKDVRTDDWLHSDGSRTPTPCK